MHSSRNRIRLRWLPAVAALCLALAGACALGWYFPARWAMPWLAPRLHGVTLHDVHGSLWHGRAGRVELAQGHDLGRASWDVSRRVVFAVAPIELRLQGATFAFAGTLRLLPNGRSEWTRATLRTDLAQWPALAAALPGAPRGEWRMTVRHALLQQGWPLELDLTGRWRAAGLVVRGVPLALGDLDFAATAHAGVVQARMRAAPGGPLDGAGELALGPLGWRLDARVRAARSSPALQRWLATLGKADDAGFVHVQRRGGLAPLPARVPLDGAPAFAR